MKLKEQHANLLTAIGLRSEGKLLSKKCEKDCRDEVLQSRGDITDNNQSALEDERAISRWGCCVNTRHLLSWNAIVDQLQSETQQLDAYGT